MTSMIFVAPSMEDQDPELDGVLHPTPGQFHFDQGPDLGLSISLHPISIRLQFSTPSPPLRGMESGVEWSQT